MTHTSNEEIEWQAGIPLRGATVQADYWAEQAQMLEAEAGMLAHEIKIARAKARHWARQTDQLKAEQFARLDPCG